MPFSQKFFVIALALGLALCGCEKKAPEEKAAGTPEAKAATTSEPLAPVDPQQIETIVRSSSKTDVDALLKKCESETNNVVLAQYATFLAKTTTRGPGVRAAFRKMLKSEDPYLREQALMALEDYAGVAFMLDDMIPLLNDENEDVRDSAMTTIADYVENRRKLQVLIDCLDSQYDDVKENAIFNLGFYTDEDFSTAEEWKKWWAEKNPEK